MMKKKEIEKNEFVEIFQMNYSIKRNNNTNNDEKIRIREFATSFQCSMG